MNIPCRRRRLFASTVIGSVVLAGAFAPAASAQEPAAAKGQQVDEVVVTGSRIRRAETTTPAPVTVIDAQAIAERGFTQAGQALNQITSAVPSQPLASGDASAAGSGQQFPNLFGLGAGRTLTLLNGRRMVTSSQGLGDRVVDTNIIPTGLIQRIDVVQAGGAAVYGSDAIAGVVNYVLKDNFEGIELDAQHGVSSRGDYPNSALRGTFGRNFADGRGNIAIDLEWSKSRPLLDFDRPRSRLGITSATNPANTSASDGRPAVINVFDSRFTSFNSNGVLFTIPAPVPLPPCGNQICFLSANGVPQQLTPDGTGQIQAYNPGTMVGVPFSMGGDGFSYLGLAALYTGVERHIANAIGHYDITDRVKVVGEFLYARTEGRDPFGTQGANFTVLSPAGSGADAIAFTRNNAFLTPGALAQLSAASSAFAAGAPLFLSKNFADLLPTRESRAETETWRALVGLEGDFDFAGRSLYWSLSASQGKTTGSSGTWATNTARFSNAVDAVRNSAGQIVCAINSDATTTNDDPACAPLNIFGNGTSITPAMRAYVSALTGQAFENTQEAYLATLGGKIFDLPGGAVAFSVAYERRAEEADFKPYEANRLGLTGPGIPTLGNSGKYHTDEFSGEILVPIFGGDFSFPLIRSLEFNGQYRRVDNSIAGKENVWGAGLRWKVFDGLTLRGSKSRNFRAPTLDQLFAPSRTALDNLGSAAEGDPCDLRYIDTGPAPAVRRANCQAEWAASPARGPLSAFQSTAVNFTTAMVTTGGNPNLRNEVSDTTTYGFVFQPTFIPGLTIVADRVEVDLEDGLSAFIPANFLATCYDATSRPADVCSTFTRDPATGQVLTALSTTFNAGTVRYEGEVYNINYSFPLGRFFDDRELGTMELALEATHTAKLATSVTGFDLTRSDGTTTNPDWVARFDARYARGPLRLIYTLNYLPEAKIAFTDTIESTPTPVIKENIRHSISAQYDLGHVTLRGGVSNITDEEPSFPTRSYGDILGRQYFVGLRARF